MNSPTPTASSAPQTSPPEATEAPATPSATATDPVATPFPGTATPTMPATPAPTDAPQATPTDVGQIATPTPGSSPAEAPTPTPFDPGGGDPAAEPTPGDPPIPPWNTVLPAEALLAGPGARANFGAALVPLADFTGDGRGDLAIGAPGHEGTLYSNGYVTLYEDAADAHPAPEPAVTFVGAAADELAGGVLAAGDLDGDGLTDLFIGAPWAAGGGRLYVVFGRALMSPAATVSLGADASRLDGGTEGWGYALAAGDLDGDGRADLAIGDPFAVVGAAEGAGRVVLFPGRDRWDWVEPPAELGPGTTIEGASTWEVVGAALSAGDLTGSGLASLAVGVPGLDSPSVTDAGGVAIFHGRLDWPASLRLDEADLVLVGEAPGGVASGAGQAVLAGCDVDGDGRGDLVVAAPSFGGADAGGIGRVYLIRGGAGLSGRVSLGVADGSWVGAAEGDGIGWALACAGDTDGDGYAEVLVSGPRHADNRGGLWLVPGAADGWPARGDLGDVPASIVGVAAGDSCGASAGVVFGAGGRRTVALGCPGVDASGVDAGAVDLIPVGP